MSGVLVIRADADRQMGTGHAMRCLALAEAWRDQGGAVHWLAASWLPALDARLAAEGIAFTRLDAAAGSPDDARLTAETARDRGAAWSVIDGYHFTAAFRETVAGDSRVLLLDDLVTADLTAADVVVNPNPVVRERYGSVPVDTQLLCGPTFALLRREFRRIEPSPAQDDSLRVLVTMGGADAQNATALVLNALTHLPQPALAIDVLVGTANPHGACLAALAAASPHTVTVMTDVTKPSTVMARADLAIVAAGTTTWELAALGVPSLLLITADNQRAVAGPMAALGGAVNLGLASDRGVATLADALAPWLTDSAARRTLGERARTIVDGDGARRVLAAMRGADLDWRDATRDDATLIWQWANDPAVRQGSFHAEPIPFEDHLAWYAARLADPQTAFWIARHQCRPIGQVRFACDGDVATISVSLAPEYRGQGWGASLIGRASRRLLAQGPVRTIVALIRQDNGASRRAFALAGYRMWRTTEVAGRPAWDMRLSDSDVPWEHDPT